MPVGCAKSILISFNLILWLAGGTLLILGTWIFVDPAKINLFHYVTSETLDRNFGFYLAYLLLSLGGVTFLVGLFGCCGAVRESRCLLVTFFVLLFLLMCIELGIAVIALIYKEHFVSGLQNRLTDQLIQNYGHKNSNEKYISFSNSVDFAQYKFKCCGINGDEDYLASKWRNDSQATTEKRQVPLSCCIQQEPGEVEEAWQNPKVKDDLACQDTDLKTNEKARNKKGCLDDIEMWFTREATILITVALSVAALQVLGMIFSMCLCRNLHDSI